MKFWLGLLAGILIGAIGLALTIGAISASSPRPEITGPSLGEGNPDVLASVQESYLSRVANDEASRLQLPYQVHDLTVDTRRGRLMDVNGTATVQILFATRDVPFTLTLRPLLQNNELRVEVVSGRVENLPLTSGIRSSIENEINNRLAEAFRQTTVRVVSVDTTDNTLILGVIVPAPAP